MSRPSVSSSSGPETTLEGLEDLAKKVLQGQVILPRFQRGFVWSRQQILELLDSIRRQYPIGSIQLPARFNRIIFDWFRFTGNSRNENSSSIHIRAAAASRNRRFTAQVECDLTLELDLFQTVTENYYELEIETPYMNYAHRDEYVIEIDIQLSDYSITWCGTHAALAKRLN